MSKELEELEVLKFLVNNYSHFEFDFSTIETALKRREELEEEKQSFDRVIEKKLKALEIIRNKKVDVKYLYCRAEFNVEKYNDNYIETLTKKECELLKEVLL